MGARQYDHDLIRTLAEGTPDPVNYIEVIHNEYTRKHGEGSIDPREIRRITNEDGGDLEISEGQEIGNDWQRLTGPASIRQKA